MELNRNHAPRSGNSAPDDSAVASDRLRKAIERNRAKRAKQEASTPQASGPARPAMASRPAQAQRPVAAQARPAAQPRPAVQARPVARPSAVAGATRAGETKWAMPEENARPSVQAAPARNVAPKTASPTAAASASYPRTEVRKPVSSAQDVELEAPLKARGTTTVRPKYTTNAPATRPTVSKKRKKKANKTQKYLEYLVIGSWAFCCILLLRLLFSDRGVIDFYSRHSVLDNKKIEYQNIQDDNQGLRKEISLIRSNKKYQKKIVRDHLGYISRSEYLILFPREKKDLSI